jgi:hypothetical protein
MSKTHTSVRIPFLVEEAARAAEAGHERDDQDGGGRAHQDPDQDRQAEMSKHGGLRPGIDLMIFKICSPKNFAKN